MPAAVPNRLFFGDNLDILREHIADASVDLIYLDPPFNSNVNYNILFREQDGAQSVAQIAAFEDTWHWGLEAEAAWRATVANGPARLSELLQSLRAFLGANDMMAYLTMMAPRLAELHRVLKPAGSIYLHCDPTASHYLKLMLDAIFGPRNFCNEVIWRYRKWATGKYTFQRNHDVILFYARSASRERTFNQLYMERAASTQKRFGDGRIVSGRDAGGRRAPSQVETRASPGVRQDDVWHISRVAPVNQLFPTQKPDALLERIITASSNEGDVVLDPFCGCGTATVAAERLNRRWIGIDITHLAISLIRHRLQDSFGDSLRPYEVHGVPRDTASAAALAAQDRYQFEWWAVSLLDARPNNDRRKGADGGIDGIINFFDDDSGRAKRVAVQVKSGLVNRGAVAQLKADLRTAGAEIGVFVTLNPPTRPMLQEAASAGFYTPAHFPDHQYPRLQIMTIDELLAGKTAIYPRYAPPATFRRSPRRARAPGRQSDLV